MKRYREQDKSSTSKQLIQLAIDRFVHEDKIDMDARVIATEVERLDLDSVNPLVRPSVTMTN